MLGMGFERRYGADAGLLPARRRERVAAGF